MALFKIHRGMAANLPKTYHEGYCYFTIDDGKFYIDTTDDASGRIVLNAASADTDRLNNIIDETYITDEELDEIFDGIPGLIDADTLGGRLASDYLLKDEFSVNYDQIIMPDGTIWDGIAATITDTELSNESDNPVANKVITAALGNIKKLSSDPRENDESNPELSAVPINADLLGGKLPSEYLSKNEQAIDSAKLGGKAPEYYAKQETVNQLSEQIENIGTPNLLVNSNFQAPYLINLNGKKEYTGIADVFNEWRTWEEDSVVTIHDGYISHTKALYQYVKSMDKDKIYTFAVKNTDGVIHVVSGKPIEQPFVYPGMNMAYDNNQDLSFVRIWPDEGVIDLVWAVLYEGMYTAETLPTPIWLHPRLEMIRMGLPVNPRNLLDNSDFTNPVNQRGQTSYMADGYSIDRWINRVNLSLTNDGVKLENTETNNRGIRQVIEKHTDRTYTAAALVNGIICTRSFTVENGAIIHGTNFNSGTGFQPYVSLPGGYLSVDFQLITGNAPITIAWAALYEGAYTAETLPPYVPKGYAAELAECQRYFYRHLGALPGVYLQYAEKSGLMIIGLPSPMRKAPSGTQNGAYNTTTGNEWHAVTLSSVWGMGVGGNEKDVTAVRLNFTTVDSYAAGSMAIVEHGEGSYIDFSCDL